MHGSAANDRKGKTVSFSALSEKEVKRHENKILCVSVYGRSCRKEKINYIFGGFVGWKEW